MKLAQYPFVISTYLNEFKVENQRFSSFLSKFFILSPFSPLNVCIYVSRCEERRFPLKLRSPWLSYFGVTANKMGRSIEIDTSTLVF